MGKTYIETIKYMIVADFTIKGLVERPDVIGAIFGQSEGLLGAELDIKELQQNGKIGRIEIEYNHSGNKTTGVLKLPCSVSMVETAIIASSIETIEKVGPCDSIFKIKQIEDTRGLKRKQIKDRAIDLLGKLMQEQIPDTRELMDEITDTFKTKEIVSIGSDKLAAGPTAQSSKEIIIVEGRADVLNLLRYGFTNAVATGGAKIPSTLYDICKNKIVTAFLDGDHGGDIQQQQLIKSVNISFVARAPDGKEVEELTQKEINQALRKKIKANYALQSTKEKVGANIVSNTKFSTTREHKVTQKTRVYGNKSNDSYKNKNYNKNDNSSDFGQMLSQIPNVERVDVDKTNNFNSNRNNIRDNRRDNNRDNRYRQNSRSTVNEISNKVKAETIKDSIVKEISKVVKEETNKPITNTKSTTESVKTPIQMKLKVISKREVVNKNNTAKKNAKKLVAVIKKVDVDNKKEITKETVEAVEDNKIESIPVKKIVLPKLTDDLKQKFSEILNEIKDKKQTRMLNTKLRRIGNCKSSELNKKLKNFKPGKIFAVVTTLDLEENLLKYAIEKEVKFLVVKSGNEKQSSQINILSYDKISK